MTESQRRKLRQIGQAGILSAEERARLILDERTERLANRAASGIPAAEPERVLVCGAGQERCGLSIGAVAEVLPFRECIPVPDGPPALVGLLGHGGHVVSVIDLGMALGLGRSSPGDEGQHLVFLRREQPRVALRVDRAYGVSPITSLTVDATGGFRNDAVTGHAEASTGFPDRERVLSLIDLDRLLHPFLPVSPASGV